MNKKITLFLVLIVVSFYSKAQIPYTSYPSDYLSEKRIAEILENARKNGTQEWEIERANQILHTQLVKQQEAIVNGTFGQKVLPPPMVTLGGCDNPNFANGTNSGWTFMSGSAEGSNLPCPTCITTAGAINVVVNPGSTVGTQCTAGVDSYGGFPVVAPAPLGVGYSLLLNNDAAGGKMEQAAQQFVVSAANNSFTFGYAVVLQSGGHPPNEQPYFEVHVTDNTTNATIPCTEYQQNAPTSGALSGWSISTVDPTVYYKPWTIVTLDFSTILGHTVTVSFTVSDCSLGGHFGYCYIDASCNPNQITLEKALCAGGGPAILAGPPGMATYAWTGPMTATTQSITTSAPGNYTLTTTSETGCPAPLLYYNLTLNPQPVPNFTTSSPPCSGALVFTDGSTIAAPDTITNWVWSFGDGSAPVDATTNANQTHSYATPGNYVVTLTDTTNDGCVATFTTTITAGGGGPTPLFTTNAPQCLAGNNVVFTNSSTATGSVTITGYSWDYGDGNTGTSTVGVPNSSHVYVTTGTFVVTLTVNVTGCSATTTQTVVINPTPTAIISAPPVCLGATTVFTSTVTNGNTYNWVFGGAGVGTNTTTATPTYSYSAAGTYPVTLVITAVGGCSVAATEAGTATVTTLNAVVSPLPTAAFSVAAVCQGTGSVFNNTSTADSACVWNFGGAGNPATAATICAPTFTYSASGTYPVTLTVTAAGGCTATATGTAVVNTFPALSFAADQPCAGTAMNFTNTTANQAAISTWNWDFGDGSTNNTASPPAHTYTAPVGFTPAGCYPVILTATATTGCTGSFSTTVNVSNNPVAYFNAYEACFGTPSEFIDSSFVQNPPCLNDQVTSWQWDFGDGNPATTYNSSTLPDTINYIYALCGTYNITLTVTTTNGCTNSNTLTGDNVFCLPNVTAPPSFSICPGTAVTTAQTAFTTTCALPAVGPAESILFVNNNPFFPNDYATSTHGGIPPADTVDFNNIPNYTSITPNSTCGLLIDTIYGVAITPISPTNFGCIGNVQTFTISVYPTPTVAITNDITVCANQQVNVPNFTGCPAPETFTWTSTTNPNTVNTGIPATDAGDIGSFTGTNSTNAVAVTTVSVTPLANGCVGPSSSFNITVNPIPVLTAIGATVCPGAMVTPTITTNPADPAAGVTYAWTVTNNTNIGMPASGTGTPAAYTAPANTTLTNQIGVITYTPVLAGCIGLPTTDTINIKPTPFMQPIADQYWCPFQQTNAVAFGTSPVSTISTYAWSYITGGTAAPTQTASVFPSLPTSNSGLNTLATVVTVAPTLNGCQGPDSTFTIFVYPQPQANFSYDSVCFSLPTSFVNTSLPNTGNNAVTNWNWNFGNGQTSFNQNPPNTFPSAGTQTVTLIVTTSPNPPLSIGGLGGCVDTIIKYPFVDPIPVANFFADSVGCPPKINTQFIDNSSVTLAGVPTGSIVSWSWVFGNGNTLLTNVPYQAPPVQTYNNTSATNPYYYNVSLTVTSSAGCTNTITKHQFIEVYPRPVADFSWEPSTANIDAPTINFANQSSGANTCTLTTPPTYGQYGVEYYLGDTYAANDSLNYVYNNTNFYHAYNYSDPSDTTQTYYVTQWVINQYGCKDSITRPVIILPDFTFYVPNAFTPNGDGINEGFKGIGEGIDNTTYNMWIFDRWGMMIYYTQNINQSWDGHMRGNDGTPVLKEDVYVWMVKFNDSIKHVAHEYHGTVTLLR